ncbi:hypothetical protein OROMI_009051 [Orobanche minor]
MIPSPPVKEPPPPQPLFCFCYITLNFTISHSISGKVNLPCKMGFSNSIICPITSAKGTNEHYSLRLDKSSGLHKAGINTPSQLKRNIQRTPHKLFAVPLGNFNAEMGPLSPAQTVMSFYSAINEKNLKQVDEIIAEDCFFEDYSFPKPFRGKKEVLHFLEQLITCMGPNMQFNVERISEGNENSLGVNWHLDWNKIQVPFTRGYSNYSLSANVDNLVIEKAQVLIESPIKLGLVALSTEVLNESAHCVSTTAKDIQDNRTACDKPIPSMSGSKGQPMVREMEKVAVAY